MTRLEVIALTVYPVKSMKGIALQRAELTPLGLAHDRRFMVVREDGQFVTQRVLPRLALIHTALEAEELVLSLESHGSARLPLQGNSGDSIRVRVWSDDCEAVDQGDDIADWLTSALQSSDGLRLVHMAPGFVRPQSKPALLGENTHTRFADSAPFLIVNQASLDALNAELLTRGHAAVPINRFRPNVVLTGLAPFAEHGLVSLAREDYAFRLCYPCQRCIVTTIDQDKAVREQGWQPYRTLADLNPMPGKNSTPAFGQNASLLRGGGAQIQVGDHLAATGPGDQP
jgi:hypothetical protein